MSVTSIAMTGAQTITIGASDNVIGLSVQASTGGGSFSFLGSFSFQGVAGEPITLTDGEGINLVASSPASPLSSIVITWISGTVNVLISR